MFEQNLDISLISPQPHDRTLKCNQFDKDTSLEEILDEFTKPESCPKRTQGEIKKAHTVLIKPIQRIPSLLLTTEPVISSSDHAKFARHVQIPRRDIKGKTLPPTQCATTRPSIEMIHNVPEIESKGPSLASNLLSGSDMPDRIKPAFPYGGGSNTLGSDLRSGSGHIRRLSSPNQIDSTLSSSRIIGATNPLANMMPNAPNRVPARPKFNVSIPEKNLNQSPSMKRNRPDLVGSSFMNSPQSTKSLSKPKSIQLKIGSPTLDPISGEYLARVLQRSGASLGGSNPGSTTESPRTADLAENNEFRIVKRGSFSVFKKMVEAECVKDN